MPRAFCRRGPCYTRLRLKPERKRVRSKVSSVHASTPLPGERLVLNPEERRDAVLEVIRGAQRELVLSLFRCDDFKILDALGDAVHRRVRVKALLTPHAKNWDRRLQDLGVFLDSMGAEVHRYSGARTKYHAKYVVADGGPALIASLNFTRKCFDETCDFILVSHQPEIISGLIRLFETDSRTPDSGLPEELDDGLIVGPERARRWFLATLGQARHTIRIIDHRVTDPEVVALLRSQQSAGVSVQVLGQGAVAGLLSHGKMLLVDDAVAAIGSISLSPPSLNVRREVAVVVHDLRNVAKLKEFFESRGVPGIGAETGEWSVPERIDDDELAEDLD
jgi:phosphatidylserine/phosphatidylglycerophosphate/cardiolipin synthase-like enzyme